MTALILAALLAGPLHAPDLAFEETSLSAGGGGAYELAGFNVAHRRGNVEAYVGLGLFSLLPGLAAGGRYYLRPDGSGFFLALNLGAHFDTLRIDERDSTGGRLFFATLTPGYRLLFKSFFAHVAIGAGLFYSMTFWRAPPSPTGGVSPVPDALVGAGYRF